MMRFIALILYVLMLRYYANLKAIRYKSTCFNRIVADKSYPVIVALDTSAILNTVVHTDNNLWWYFYYNVSQLMGLKYSPILKRKLVQTSISIHSHHII